MNHFKTINVEQTYVVKLIEISQGTNDQKQNQITSKQPTSIASGG